VFIQFARFVEVDIGLNLVMETQIFLNADFDLRI